MLTVPERFERLLQQIQPTPRDLQNLEASRQHLSNYLSSRIETVKFLLMGSHTRGTAITGSDMDLLQVIKKEELMWGGNVVSSSTVLENVRRHLSAYGKSEIRRDRMALVVDYTSGAQIDLVPGYYVGPGVSNYPVFEIPNGLGGWLKASPEAHNAYIKQADEKARGKLKKTVQMVKYWRQCRVNQVRLNSFHLEIVLASSGVCEGLKSYSQCLAGALDTLAKREAKALRDPIGVAGLIAASGSQVQASAAANSLAGSSEHALKAVSAERQGSTLEAVRQWSLVFNGVFP